MLCVYIGWKTRVDPPTAACPEVWKLRFTEANSPEGKNPQAIRQGQMKKGYYNYFTPWEIAGLAQRGLSSSLWDVRFPSFGKGLSPKTAAVILCSEHRSQWQ